MFTWPIVLLVVLGVSSLAAAGVMSLKLHAFGGDGAAQHDDSEPHTTP